MILVILEEKPRTLEQLIEIIYKGDVKPDDPRYGAARRNTREHLKKLESEGKV